MRTEDMYGHTIYPLGDTGYGVSVSFYTQGGGPPAPDLTFFHSSDGFRQALFSVAARGFGTETAPAVHNIFHDRVDEVAVRAERDHLLKALADWKMEIANCTNCHYHRHIARSAAPYHLGGQTICDECREDVEEL